MRVNSIVKAFVALLSFAACSLAQAANLGNMWFELFESSRDRMIMNYGDFNMKDCKIAIPVENIEPGETFSFSIIPGSVDKSGAITIKDDETLYNYFWDEMVKGRVAEIEFAESTGDHEIAYEGKSGCEYEIDDRVWHCGENPTYGDFDNDPKTFNRSAYYPNRKWLIFKVGNAKEWGGLKTFTVVIDVLENGAFKERVSHDYSFVAAGDSLGAKSSDFVRNIKITEEEKEDFYIEEMESFGFWEEGIDGRKYALIYAYGEDRISPFYSVPSAGRLVIGLPKEDLSERDRAPRVFSKQSPSSYGTTDGGDSYYDFNSAVKDIIIFIDSPDIHGYNGASCFTKLLFYPANKRSVGITAMDMEDTGDGEKYVLKGFTKGVGVYSEGETATLTAVSGGAKFAGWKVISGELPKDVNLKANPLKFKVTSEIAGTMEETREIVVAPIWQDKKLLKLDVGAGGSVTGSGTYFPDSKVTIKAKPVKGNVFAGWYTDKDFTIPYESDTDDFRNPSLTLNTQDCDTQLFAKFLPIEYDSLDVRLWAPDLPGYHFYDPIKFNRGDDFDSMPLDIAEKFEIKSESLPTVKITGLPAGLKFDAKTLKVKGKVTESKEKWGALIVSVKNASGYAATSVWPISVNGAEDPAKEYGEDDLLYSYDPDLYDYAFGIVDGAASMKNDIYSNVLLDECETYSYNYKNGGHSESSQYSRTLKFSGLPTGLKVTTSSTTEKAGDDESGYSTTVLTSYILSGAPTKPGRYTVSVKETITNSSKVNGEKYSEPPENHVKKFDIYVQQAPSRYVEFKVMPGEDGKPHGKVNSSGIFASGSTIKSSAKADKGYVFAGWYCRNDLYGDEEKDYISPFHNVYNEIVNKKSPLYSIASTTWFVGNSYGNELTTVFPRTIYARFIPVGEDMDPTILHFGDLIDDGVWQLDMESERAEHSFYCEYESEFWGYGGSHAEITSVKGLPNGIKVETDGQFTTIYHEKGTTVAPGSYSVVVTAKNLTGLSSTYSFTLKVPHTRNEFMSVHGLDQEMGYSTTVGWGSEKNWNLQNLAYFVDSVMNDSELSKVSVSFSNLPKGVSIKKVDGLWTVIGVPTKAGNYTVTAKVSATNSEGRSVKESATFTFAVAPLPESAIGTYDGYLDFGNGADMLKVSMTISSTGAISAKAFDWRDSSILKGAKFSITSVDEGSINIEFTRNGEDFVVEGFLNVNMSYEYPLATTIVGDDTEGACWYLKRVNPIVTEKRSLVIDVSEYVQDVSANEISVNLSGKNTVTYKWGKYSGSATMTYEQKREDGTSIIRLNMIGGYNKQEDWGKVPHLLGASILLELDANGEYLNHYVEIVRDCDDSDD